MKKKIYRTGAALLLAVLLVFSLAGCSGEGNVSSELSQQQTEIVSSDTDSSTQSEVQLDTKTEINVMALSGTTGFGMAKLMDDAQNKTAALNYNITVESDASNVTAALINGTVQIAALPTNAAAAVYNKSKGGVKLLAINTLGVLYLMENSESENITSFEDLRGKTVYVPAQNPTFIFKYLCEQNGLKVGEDIIIDNTYAQPADLRTAFAAGEISLAVLPEPMVTMAKSANESLKTALDLTAEWDKVAPEGSLVQGCVVVNTAFAEEHGAELAKFLEEYETSINYLTEDTAAASALIESTGIFAKAAVAAKAIPNCNICFIKGEEMKTQMSDFLSIMFSVEPASVGGAIPADDFYYIG